MHRAKVVKLFKGQSLDCRPKKRYGKKVGAVFVKKLFIWLSLYGSRISTDYRRTGKFHD